MKTDIISWITEHFIDIRPYDLDNVRVNCPFCPENKGSEDKDYHLHIHTRKSMIHCFRCGMKGNWVTLISFVEQCSTGAALSRLHSMSFNGLTPLYTLLHNGLTQDPVNMPEDFVSLSVALHDESVSAGVKVAAVRAKEYVYRRLRKLPVDSSHYKISQYLEEWGVWKHNGYGKLVMPVERGWWQTRTILSDYTGAKYVNPHLSQRDRIYNARALKCDYYVYIAEGIISAVFLGKQAVALCRKDATKEQLKRLVLAPVGWYIVALDSDAQTDALKLAKQLHSAGKRVSIRQYQEGDPAEYTWYWDIEYENSLTEAKVRLG